MSKGLLLEIAGGVRIAVPADLRTLSTFVFLEQEDWFEDEAAFVRALARPGFRMLDVGANVGFYALTAAALAGPSGRVWAVEPAPDTASLLRESVAANGFAQIDVLQLALSDRAGQAALTRTNSPELDRLGEAGVAVERARLDDLAGPLRIERVDFVKIDVEGHEPEVVAGAAGFLARESPLVMLEVRAGRQLDWRAAEALQAAGYELFRLVPGLGLLAPLRRDAVDPALLNVFACKPDRVERLGARGLLARPAATAPALSTNAVVEALVAIPAFAGLDGNLRRLLAGLSEADPCRRMVVHALAAQDARLGPDRRLAALLAAAAAARGVASSAGLAARITAARVLIDVGERGAARRLAHGLYEEILADGEIRIDAPFLPMLRTYETLPANAGLAAWIKAMIVEALWRWWSYSGITARFTPTEHPADSLRRFGRELPEFERRRQLRAMLERRQAGPDPARLPAQRRPDHLNAAWWRGELSNG